MESHKRHGAFITIASCVVFISLLILSDGWDPRLSFMGEISNIYLYAIYGGQTFVESVFFLRTKYLLVLSIAAMAYGFMIYARVLKDPFGKDEK